MPELILFGVCEKGIIDNETNYATLVNVVAGFRVLLKSSDLPLPPDAVNPWSWSAVILWRPLPDETQESFELKIEVYFPDGNRFEGIQGTVKFKLPKDSHHSNRINVNGFPFATQGTYRVRLSLREDVDGSEWNVVANYPVDIGHQIT